jgi:hypothetical protein
VISDASLRVFEDAELEAEILGLMTVQTAAGWRLDHRLGGYSDRAMALGIAICKAIEQRRVPGSGTWTQKPDPYGPGAGQIIDRQF